MEQRRRPAARNRRHGKNRGRFSFLYKFLSIILISAALIVGLTLFFKTAEVRVEGAARYTQSEIAAASGVEMGDNLILLDKYAVANRIFGSLPYVDTVVIRRRLPTTLVITVTECTEAAAIESGGAYYLMDAKGKLLAKCDAAGAAGHPLVLGADAEHPIVGDKLKFQSGEEARLEHLTALLAALGDRDMLKNVQSIGLSEETYLRIDYLDRFTVLIPTQSDYPFKLKYLDFVVASLASNDRGTIDLTREEAHFIPTVKN